MSFESALEKNKRIPKYSLSNERLSKAQSLWNRTAKIKFHNSWGFNTMQIAMNLSVAEHVVYNHIGKIKVKR